MGASEHEDVRQAALKEQSDDHLRFALQGGPSAAPAAYQAGYCALLSAMSSDEAGGFFDHPNATMVAAAAERLQLSATARTQGELGAGQYYAADQVAFSSLEEWLTWAHGVRAARGWSS